MVGGAGAVVGGASVVVGGNQCSGGEEGPVQEYLGESPDDLPVLPGLAWGGHRHPEQHTGSARALHRRHTTTPLSSTPLPSPPLPSPPFSFTMSHTWVPAHRVCCALPSVLT